MHPTHIICHYNEIALKKGNRGYFEKILVHNIKVTLKRSIKEDFSVKRHYGYILITLPEKINKVEIEYLTTNLKYVFGLVHFSLAVSFPLDLDIISKEALQLLQQEAIGTFCVSARRLNKNFTPTSPEINKYIGAHLVDNTNRVVSIKNPDTKIHVDILDNFSLIYTKKIPCLGGLPVGTAGRGLVLLSGGFDSPVATWYMMKRGLSLSGIHFHNLPYTQPQSVEKVRDLSKIFSHYQQNFRLFLIPFTKVQQEIVKNCTAELRVILYRRFMLRIAEVIAHKYHIKTLITGDALSQVASQTIENITVMNQVATLPILRPLIGFDKDEIMAKARTIGTYTISEKQHEDCCSRFIPEHPTTKAHLEEILETEKSLDSDKLIEDALTDITIEIF